MAGPAWLQTGHYPAFLQSLPASINWMHDAGLAGNDFRTIPTSYTPEKLRSFVLQGARSHGIKRARTIVTAVRAFLRFLGATGKCPAGMEYAIPGFAAGRLLEVPKFLEPVEVEQLIASCTDDFIGRRNRAVLLLLARLGLRASEVAQLKFDDIDWVHKKIMVCGRGRHNEWLPLT